MTTIQQLDGIVEAIETTTTSLLLNEKQREAIAQIRHWFLESHKPYFVLGGFAGTGKTTVVKSALDTLHLPEDEVALCAYTAKAARVLQLKTPPFKASTIHSLIYRFRSSKPLEMAKEQLAEVRKTALSPQRDAEIQKLKSLIAEIIESLKGREYRPKTDAEFFEKADIKLIIADECSMIGQRLFDQLLSYGVKVLFIGDPGQLDPISEGAKEKTLHQLAPIDFLLEEIVRHDNAIVEMASLARHKQHIPFTEKVIDGFGRVSQDRIPDRVLLTADQILCLKHVTRRELNRRVRAANGLTSIYPLAGEKVVCRLNNHAYEIARGVTYTLLEDAKPEGEYLSLNLNGIDVPILAHKAMFHAYHDDELAEDVDKNRVSFKSSRPPFDFGYALTVHSAQGSEWERVLVWNDYKARKHQPAEYAKWLYTALTRARETCIMAS